MIRSLQLNTTVFFAENSLRRNVAQYNLNYASTSSEFRVIGKTLDSAETLMLTNSDPIVGCILRTSATVTVICSPRDGSDPVALTVKKFMFLDQDFASIEIVATTNGTNLQIQIA
jgi:hypothetical protein